jgi:hypothetical protein
MNFSAVPQSPESAGGAPRDGRGDDVAEGIRRVVAAEVFLVDVGLEDVGGLIRVELDIKWFIPAECECCCNYN